MILKWNYTNWEFGFTEKEWMVGFYLFVDNTYRNAKIMFNVSWMLYHEVRSEENKNVCKRAGNGLSDLLK